MENIPKRDITGECEGECRDRVREGEEERQDSLGKFSAQESGGSKSVSWAASRNAPPGSMGGRV
jgi:hypothetical protein